MSKLKSKCFKNKVYNFKNHCTLLMRTQSVAMIWWKWKIWWVESCTVVNRICYRTQHVILGFSYRQQRNRPFVPPHACQSLAHIYTNPIEFPPLSHQLPTDSTSHLQSHFCLNMILATLPNNLLNTDFCITIRKTWHSEGKTRWFTLLLWMRDSTLPQEFLLAWTM